MRHVFVRMVIKHVAQHQRRAWHPWRADHGCHIWLQNKIAITLFPACGLVTWDGFHLDINAEQIIAGMGFFVSAINKKLRMKTLARQAPLHVGESYYNSVDVASLHFGFKLFKCQFTVAHFLSPLVAAFISGTDRRCAHCCCPRSVSMRSFLISIIK